MADKSAEESFAEEQARLAISQKYLARDDNPDLDPMRQDQLDRNRPTGELGEGQLSPNSEARSRQARAEETALDERGQTLFGTVAKSLDEQPYATLVLTALLGVVLGAIWKS